MQTDPLQQAYEHFQAGQFKQAGACCHLVLGPDPDHVEANHFMGAIRFQQGRVDEALVFLRRAVASPRANAEMHNNLGAILYKLGDIPGAITAFERALAMRPGYADALNNLAVLYRETQQTDKAIEKFQEAVALNPDLLRAKANLRSAYHDMVPGWHFAMLADKKRNEAYEAAIRRAVPGKRVLDIGTGSGLLSMMAARAGAAKVTTCEAVPLIAERAKLIIAQNGMADRIQVIPLKSNDITVPEMMAERAEVLVTETFASGLITEGVLPTVEHAHEHLLTPDATIIPYATSVMGYLAGGSMLEGMLFVDKIAGFDLSSFNDFAPPMLAAVLDVLPHRALSDDIELMRFDLREKSFPMGGVRLALKATQHGVCAGVAQWIRLELDAETRYENRPGTQTEFNGHWTQVIHRFPKLVTVRPGDIVPVLFRHDRNQIGIDLIE